MPQDDRQIQTDLKDLQKHRNLTDFLLDLLYKMRDETDPGDPFLARVEHSIEEREVALGMNITLTKQLEETPTPGDITS